MKEQKFKRGNLVKVLVGHQIWSNKEIVNYESETTISATWQAVIQFIQWYNQNIKHNG